MKDKLKNRKGILGIIIAIIIILIVAIVCLFIFHKDKDDKVTAKYDSKGNPVYVDESKIKDIFTNPSAYKGLFVDLSGQIFIEPETNDGVLGFQMFADPNGSNNNVVVYYNGLMDLRSDDYVKLTGYICGEMTGTNAFGGEISALVIAATKLEKSSYVDIISPTIRKVDYSDKIINQSEYKIEVNKVEFAENQTRVYVTAYNDSTDDFNIYTYSVKAIQNGKQYEISDSSYDADLPKLQTEIKGGVSSSGVLIFDAMEQTDFKLVIDSSSDNWDIRLDEYTFNLEVK